MHRPTVLIGIVLLSVGVLLAVSPPPTARPAPGNAALHVDVISWAAFANVKVTNGGTSGTGTYEQQVSFPSSTYKSFINANWTNVRFVWANATSTTVYAWVETNASNASAGTPLWLHLFNIAPGTSVNVTAQYDTMRTDFDLAATGPTGEAPQLSVYGASNLGYGKFDDGCHVFNLLYVNYVGSTGAQYKNCVNEGAFNTSVDGSAIQSNGIVVSSSLSTALGGLAFTDTVSTSRGVTWELNYTKTSSFGWLEYAQVTTVSNAQYGQNQGYVFYQDTAHNYIWSVDASGNRVIFTSAGGPFKTGSHVLGGQWTTNGTLVWKEDYQTVDTSGAVETTFSPTSYLAFGSGFTSQLTVNWTRLRATPDTMPTVLVTATTPSAPTGLTLQSINRNSAILNWTNPAGTLVNTTGYLGLTAGTLHPYTAAAGGVTLMGWGSLVCSTSYYFAVTVWNAQGQSPLSNVVNAATSPCLPPAPTALTLGTVTSSTVALTWTNPVGYGLVNDTIAAWLGTTCTASPTVQFSTGGAAASGTAIALSTNTTYAFAVEAWNGSGASPFSNCVHTTTLAGASSGGGLFFASSTLATAYLSVIELGLAGAVVTGLLIAFAKKKKGERR